MLLNTFPRIALLATLLGLVATSGCTDPTPVRPPPVTPSNTCGDSKVADAEECDDGNTVSGDGCDAACKKEMVVTPVCGDNVKDMGEECDDGNTVSGDGCDAMCKTEASMLCGNGLVDPGEKCDDGNTKDGDGCESTCVHTPVKEVMCANLPPLASGTCEVAAGDGGRLLLGTVLAPDAIYRGGQVLIDAKGIIVNVGCDCSTAADPAACTAAAMSATKVTCPSGVISPGLINTHDHITFTQNSPYTDTGERYEHRHDWRVGKNGHTKLTTPGGASADEVAWGELRFLMGGATSTVGSGTSNGLLRNLDKAAQEGLGQMPVDFQTFPLGDSNGTQLASTCAYPNIIQETAITGEDAFFPHVAEGINAFAENEFVCMSSSANGGQDLVQPQSAFIHSVGLGTPDYATMAVDGTALIWSPRSNITLYGNTAVVTEASRLGVLIALGTDWIATGSMNMLRELRCADELNSKYYGGYFTDQQLWQMATSNAAAATATDDVIGALVAGKVADISIFDGKAHPDFRAVIDANPEDVALVMRAGKVLYGDEAAVAAIGGGACDAIDVCGTQKQVCVAGELGKNLAALTTAVGGIYTTFFCGGPPMNEPSCTPSRPLAVNGSTIYDGTISADDNDGDGIPNAMDNCPLVFNPVRPMDNGQQGDFDGDGVGDACDVCPVDANTTACKGFDPNDTDGDGKPNLSDNCPAVANPLQEDADMDGKGDVCDPCPNQANPGGAACKVTIYDIKTGVAKVGDAVALDNALVTGRSSRGFFLQVKPGDPDYAGSDNSGIYVFDPTNTVKAGDRVTISSATVANYFGQIQLTGPTTVVNMSLNEAPPDPVHVTTGEVATGGAKETTLEAVIVEVAGVTVTDVAPAPGMGDALPTNEFVIDDGSGGVRVNDFLYLESPLPALNDTYTNVSGVLQHHHENSKIELRSGLDLKGGLAKIGSFGPSPSFANASVNGQMTYPSALTLSLVSPPLVDTFVAIASSDPASVVVTGGGVTIPAGAQSAPVLVDGLAASAAAATLTATLNGTMFTASVRTLDGTETPTLVSLTPDPAIVQPGGTKTFTVGLDIPATAGGAVISLVLGPANAGTIPGAVTVPAGQLTATFDYVDGNMTSSAMIMATLGAQTLMSTLTIEALATNLVINEVDYDQGLAGPTDDAEFIEIYNGTGAPVDLTGYALYLVNGSGNAVYTTVDLGPAGTLANQQYLVVASATVNVPATELRINFAAATNNIQNGAPDGVALVNTATNTLVDAFSYEGSITAAALPVPGTVSLVEGAALPAAVADSNIANGSLSRLPNGTDKNNAATDWNFTGTPTPGAPNVP